MINKIYREVEAMVREDEVFDPERTAAAWAEFSNHVIATTPAADTVEGKLRSLHFSLAEFTSLFMLARERGNACEAALLVGKVIIVLRGEIDIIRMGIRYPHIHRPAKDWVSPLHLSETCTQTDLIEVIKGFYLTDSVVLEDGTPAQQNDISEGFSVLFNEDLRNFSQKSSAAISRQKGPAQFLERMIRALVGRSRK